MEQTKQSVVKPLIIPSIICAVVITIITYFLSAELMLDEAKAYVILGAVALVIFFWSWRKGYKTITTPPTEMNVGLKKAGKLFFLMGGIPIGLLILGLTLLAIFYEFSSGGEEGYAIAYLIAGVGIICVPLVLLGIIEWHIAKWGWKRMLKIYSMILLSLLVQFVVFVAAVIVYEQIFDF